MTVRELAPSDKRRRNSSEAMSIRPLERKDVESVIEMGREEWPNVFPNDAFDADHMRAILMCHFNADCFGAWVVVSPQDVVFGFLGLGISPLLMTRRRVAADTWWYVHPSVRGRLGIQLVKTGEAWARSMGAVTMHLGVFNEEYRPILERLLKYNLSTLHFQKEL